MEDIIIQELPESTTGYQGADEPLLEYIWEIADEYMPSYEMNAPQPRLIPSDEPMKFVHKYKRGLINTEFKDKLLKNEDLTDTLNLFGFDISKFWYLLLFVHNYIEENAQKIPTVKKSDIEEADSFLEELAEADEITLMKGKRKSYKSSSPFIIGLIRNAMNYYVNNYNAITTSGDKEQLKQLGLSEYLSNDRPLDFKNRHSFDYNTRIIYFYRVFHAFLRDKKAMSDKGEYKISKDKNLLISRLLYTVGYVNNSYNEEFDEYGKRQRKLSQLIRRYKENQFILHTERLW
jgi:hypothetical protein